MADRAAVVTQLQSPVHLRRLLSEIHSFIVEGIRNQPEYFLRELAFKDTGKTLIGADIFSERLFAKAMHDLSSEHISVEGEENLAPKKNLDLRDSTRVHILCD